MQCTANHTSNQDDVRYLEKEGALGEAVPSAGADQAQEGFCRLRQCRLLQISMTQ